MSILTEGSYFTARAHFLRQKQVTLGAVISYASADMVERPKTPQTPEKKLFEVTSKIIKLRDPVKPGSSTTVETAWQMPDGAIVKGTYVGAPGRWTLQASGAPVRPEMAAQLDAIEARSLAARTS